MPRRKSRKVGLLLPSASALSMRIADLLPIVINLCRFRGGPQDIPYRPSLLLGLLIASIALDLVSAELLGVSEAALGRSLFSTGLLLSLCWLALRICGFASRYVQTASALVACSIVFSLLIVPLALLFGDAPAEQSTVSPAQALVAWLGLLVLVWKIAVDGFVVRHAINAPYWLGFCLAMAWTVADFALSRMLFAPPA